MNKKKDASQSKYRQIIRGGISVDELAPVEKISHYLAKADRIRTSDKGNRYYTVSLAEKTGYLEQAYNLATNSDFSHKTKKNFLMP